MAKICKLSQRSDEWHEWRNQGIGASEACILEGNGRITPYALWEKKCGFTEDSNYLNGAMAHGIHCEEIALKAFNKEMELGCVPLCVEDEEHPYIRASLDGYDEREEILIEIKSPVSESTLSEAREREIKEEWAVQMQWQMMIVKPKRAFLVVWDHPRSCFYSIEQFPDVKRWETLRCAAQYFWNNVVTSTPPPMQSPDYLDMEGDIDLLEAAREYESAHLDFTRARRRLSELKRRVLAYGPEGNFRCGPIKVTKVHPKRTLNKEAMEEDGIELSSYMECRGEPYSRISLS